MIQRRKAETIRRAAAQVFMRRDGPGNLRRSKGEQPLSSEGGLLLSRLVKTRQCKKGGDREKMFHSLGSGGWGSFLLKRRR